MLILKKIYSDTGLFDKVEFHKGINIIQGVYTRSEEEKRELNGIGKSTLVRLIDFTLLSSTNRKRYFDPIKYKFLEGHSATLEFVTGNKSHFIRREFDNPRNPRYGTALTSMDVYTEEELKNILGKLFFAQSSYDGYYENGWFRNLLRFFIKDDINNFERKDPLNFISQHKRQFESYSYNLFLLNLPNRSVVQYDELRRQVEDLRKQKRKVIARLKDETGKAIEEINSEIRQLDNKIGTFQKSIDEYSFLDCYKNVEHQLIEISNQVTILLTRMTFVEKKLNEYRKSYEYEIEIDQNKIAKLYSEVGRVFGEVVRRSLEDVTKFRKKLAENREIFLKGRESELGKELEELRSKISALEKERSLLYKVLDEKQALDSIKNTYSLLIDERTKKERLLTSVSQVTQLDDSIAQTNSDITRSISSIAGEMRSIQKRIDKISSLFFEIVKETIRLGDLKEAVFDIRPSPDMKSPLKITIDVPKSNALGKSRFKILAYDLTAFLNIVETRRELPHFLIHDGVFHGIDIKTVVRILNLVNSKFLQHQDFQYIITANENEVFIPTDKKEIYGTYNFDLQEAIAVTYKDIEEGMIFKREY